MLELMSGGSGASFSRRIRKTRDRKNKAPGKTLPTLASVFPYHEMLMLNLLGVGEFQVKTRNSNWNYRGLVLLYTSHGRYHRVPANAYDLNPNDFPRGVIVGVATVVNSRPLTWEEKIQMTRNFNMVDSKTAEGRLLIGSDSEWVIPLPVGVFLKDIKRFKKPVPFKPRPGAIGIMRVPLQIVAKALREAGIDPKNL